MALPHAKAGDVVDLRPLGESLRHTVSTAIVKSDRFEAIRLVVPEAATIPAHHVPGYVTFHCIEGRISLEPIGVELDAGEWTYLDRGTQYSIRGIRDASLLLTIHFDEKT